MQWTKRCFPLCLLFLTCFASAQVRDALPVPDLPGYKTLRCDFHQHTVFSDGEVWPTTRVMEAWRDGLDAIAITDHSEYHPHEKDVTYDGARPHAIAQTLAEQLGMILVPGIEVSQGDIHCNALFVQNPNGLRGTDLKDVLRRARAQDAFVFWNHPGWKQKAEWFPLIATAYEEKLIQGMEIVNGNTFYPEAFPWVEEKGLTILANSDVHRLASGRARPVTLVFARTADVGGVREALLAHRSAAWMGGEVWGAEAYLKGLFDGAIKVENSEPECRAGAQFGIRLWNRSAIPATVRVLRSPKWLRLRGAELKAEAITGIPVTVDRSAPAGANPAELELEVTNFHTASGRNLVVTVPLRVNVQ